MSARIGPAPWMTAGETAAVLNALEAEGGPDCARFVGGCVRDALLGRPVSDVDIATTLPPDRVSRTLKAAGLRAVPTGVEHGTVTAVSGGRPFEITTLRRDVSTDGRRAVVAFTEDWLEDAERRDFTLNALYARRNGEVFDSSGRGVEDARAGRIVFMGDPVRRILEDHLRILRFFRFFAWFGRGEPDGPALAACAEHKGAIASLAAERISTELLKLLGADDPRRALRLMAQTGVLATVLPDNPSSSLSVTVDNKTYNLRILGQSFKIGDSAKLNIDATAPEMTLKLRANAGVHNAGLGEYFLACCSNDIFDRRASVQKHWEIDHIGNRMQNGTVKITKSDSKGYEGTYTMYGNDYDISRTAKKEFKGSFVIVY